MASRNDVKAKLNRKLSKNYGEKKAVLGNRLGVVDVGGGYCNVTLKNGDVIQILNRRVPMKPFRKVIIGYDQGRKESNSILEVLRFDDVYLNNKEPEVPGHAGLHGWLGTDPISVYSQQIVPLLPRSKQSMVVSLFGGNILVGEVFGTIPNMEFDFSSYIPTSGARWVSVEIDSSFETHFHVGESQISRAALTPAHIPTPTSLRRLLFSVKTYLGQTKVVESSFSSDIFDPRLTGYSGGTLQAVTWEDITEKPEVFAPDPDDLYVVVSEDLSHQVDGTEDHFTIGVSTAPPTIAVYLNGVKLRQLEIVLDSDMLGFTLSPPPLSTDKIEVEFLAIPMRAEDGSIYTDSYGHIYTF